MWQRINRIETYFFTTNLFSSDQYMEIYCFAILLRVWFAESSHRLYFDCIETKNFHGRRQLPNKTVLKLTSPELHSTIRTVQMSSDRYFTFSRCVLSIVR